MNVLQKQNIIVYNYEPRSDCSYKNSLIRAHSVCFYGKVNIFCTLNLCSRHNMQVTFLGKIRLAVIGLKWILDHSDSIMIKTLRMAGSS